MYELGSLDFETFSEAGHVFDPVARKWRQLPGAPKGKRKGLGVVGAAAYAEHPSTEVLTLSYRLPGERQVYRWRPGDPLPQRLFDALAAGAVFKAHNLMFEFLIWELCCVPKYGWPSILPWRYQFRCTMATARVNSLPGGLDDLSKVLQLPTPKDADGKRLLDKFSVPRNPTKADPRVRITPPRLRPEGYWRAEGGIDFTAAPNPADVTDFEKLQAYCDTDTEAEEGAYARMVPMSADELLFWWVDQEINWRGVGVDRAAVRDCIAVLEQAFAQYGDEFRALTNGLDPTQLQALGGWLAAQGVHMSSMDAEAVEEALERLPPHPPGGCYPARRVLEIRQLIGSASVKKLYALENCTSADNRIRNIIIHHGARTGRPTGDLAQPLNMPREGPSIQWCASPACHRPYGIQHAACPWCLEPANPTWRTKWSGRPKGLPDTVPSVVDFVLEAMSYRSLDYVELMFGDAVDCIGGCIRGLFVADPGNELIASDYTAIEAVVIAALAGEQWRLDVIASGVDIYLAGGSKITGLPIETYTAYKDANGEHHPDRQKKFKVAELACGFGGWVGALRAFGYEGSDEEAKALVLAWRAASPKIVEMWGGQYRGLPWEKTPFEYFGFEGAFVQAVLHPGVTFRTHGCAFTVRPHPAGWDALFLQLPSTRELTYHRPALQQSTRDHARAGEYAITFWTHNSNPKYGAMGWVPMSTYGPKIAENVVQAVAHDILREAILNLRAAGYPTVLHVYDEVLAEIPRGTGSLAEFERIMAALPSWAAGWPIKAAGGWVGARYRKG